MNSSYASDGAEDGQNSKAERKRQHDFLGPPGLDFPDQSAGDEQDLGSEFS